MSTAYWIIGLFIVFRIGWELAHVAIAAECERLGGFFVGKKTYKCVEIKEVASHE